MRLVTFSDGERVRPGALSGERVTPLDPQFPTLLALAEAGSPGLNEAQDFVARAKGTLPLSEVTLLAPFPTPRRNIFCLGQNYLEHAKESARMRNLAYKPAARPAFFTKATTTVAGPYADIPVNPTLSPKMDWEAELGVVLGRAGKDIAREQAPEYVFGYTVINDITARDLQDGFGGQFFKGKSLDLTCPMGPWIVTRDEMPDAESLPVICRVNGVVKQNGNTSDLIFKIPDIIYWLSLGMTLLPGDILSTGTPSGIGNARTPAEYLQPGDLLETEVTGIGVLSNRIVGSGG